MPRTPLIFGEPGGQRAAGEGNSAFSRDPRSGTAVTDSIVNDVCCGEPSSARLKVVVQKVRRQTLRQVDRRHDSLIGRAAAKTFGLSDNVLPISLAK